jgi:hypothetical protein
VNVIDTSAFKRPLLLSPGTPPPTWPTTATPVPEGGWSAAHWSVLLVLQQAKRALFIREVIGQSVSLHHETKRRLPWLTESTAKKRIQELIELGLIARPSGTRRQGLVITEAGKRALAEVNPLGNS